MLMGSDAEYIVRRAPAPVLLVRNQESADREAT
jgi:nucleotide-binding universal stress UspA family protein